MTDKALLPIADMATGYQNGSLTPSEVVDETLKQIEKLEPNIGHRTPLQLERLHAHIDD